MVLEQHHGAPADLADQEVELAVIAEVGGDDGAAVAIAIGAGQAAHVQKVMPANIEENTFAFEGAEIVPSRDDVPWVFDPELAQGLIERTRGVDVGTTVETL